VLIVYIEYYWHGWKETLNILLLIGWQVEAKNIAVCRPVYSYPKCWISSNDNTDTFQF